MQRWEDADAHPSEATFQALTDALFSRADWSGLLEAAQRWLAFSPRSPAARGALGIAHLSLGHHDQAVTIFQAMVSAAPDDPAIADRAGVHLLLTDRADLADPLFRQTIAAYPDDPVPVRHLALLLWQRQHPEEAVEVLEQFLRAHPDSIDVRPILLDDLALAYHAALAAGGDDWAIRQRAARLGVSLDHWRDVRVVVEWAPTHEAVELHLAHTSLANGGTTRDLDKLVPPRNEVEDMGGILSARLIPPLPGRWHVGVGTSSPTSAPVHGTVMVIAPAFRDRVALVLIQPFSLMPGASQVRHVLSFDLPGGGAPPEVAGETRIEP